MDVDAVVIGAGVIGASIALELQRSGRRVLVADKGEAVGGGSTSASSAIVRFTYSTRPGVIAAWESHHRWLAWDEHLGGLPGPQPTYHRIGMLHLPEPHHDLGPMLGHFDAVGVPHELLGPEALATRFPALDPARYHPPRRAEDPRFFDPGEPGGLVGLHVTDGGFIDDPMLAAANLADAARRHGATIRLRTAVASIERTGGRVTGVGLAGGDLVRAPVVVNAAGPWSARVNDLAGIGDDLRLGTRALRQEVVATPVPEGFGVADGGTVLADLDLGAYARPQPGGSYLIGGVEAACDPLHWIEDPDDDRTAPDTAAWETLVLRAARRLPGLAVPHRPSGLVGHYDVTPDWVPIYDRTSLDGYYLAIGTSGNQFKNAPLVGDLLRELIDACEAGHDHDAEPVQVRCRHTGLALDLGHYARGRQPAATSGTVMG